MRRIKPILAVVCLLLLASCTVAQPQINMEATPVGTDDSAPLATQSGTLPDGWTVYDPHDPSIPDLIISSENDLMLNPDWQVASVGLRYEWVGLGDGVLSFTEIAREGDAFMSNGKAIPSEEVNAFLRSISDLHPTQRTLAANMWTDDYPEWIVEITGTDGQYVYLYSSSTGNPGSGPWNVWHNGRMFAQYTGDIGNALGKIFSQEQGSPAAAFFPGTSLEEGQVAFTTEGQIVEGWGGLLKLGDSFYYTSKPETGTIEGEFVDTVPYNHFEEEPVDPGSIVLNSITITVGNAEVQCSISKNSDDPYNPVWEYECPLGDHAPAVGDRYRFPTHIDYRIAEGEETSVDGEIRGEWGTAADILMQPLPPEIEAALASSPEAKDLLTDHLLGNIEYTAAVNPANPNEGTYNGELTFMGQTEINGQRIRYTLGTPFTIKDGQLTRFALTRSGLNAMLDTIRQQAITARVIEADPSLTLSLWYAESSESESQEALYLINSHLSEYTIGIGACQDRASMTLPNETHPLSGFGFNSRLQHYWMPDFLIIDGEVQVGELDLFPDEDDWGRGSAFAALLPPALDTGSSRPFGRIWFQSSDMFDEQPSLTLWVPEDATPEELDVYTTLADALPAEVDRSSSSIWEITNIEGYLTPEGLIEIRSCN